MVVVFKLHPRFFRFFEYLCFFWMLFKAIVVAFKAL
jgi:hypothetical protein